MDAQGIATYTLPQRGELPATSDAAVTAAVKEQDHALRELHDALSSLEDRLTPVLRVEPNLSSEALKDVMQPCSPLAADIRANARAAGDAVFRINTIIGRLEI